MSDKFIAQAADFRKCLKCLPYELLFRTRPGKSALPDAMASQSVIVAAWMVSDMERLIGPAKAFVNMDEKGVAVGRAKLLDPRARGAAKFSDT